MGMSTFASPQTSRTSLLGFSEPLRGEAFSRPRLRVNRVGRSSGSVLFKSLCRGTGTPVTARRETDFVLGGAHLEDGLEVGAGQERLDQTLLHLTLKVDEGLCALAIQRVEDEGGSTCPSAFLSPPSWRWASRLLQLREDHTDGHFCDGPEVKGIQIAELYFLRRVVDYGIACKAKALCQRGPLPPPKAAAALAGARCCPPMTPAGVTSLPGMATVPLLLPL